MNGAERTRLRRRAVEHEQTAAGSERAPHLGRAAAKEIVRPDALTWVVVGDLSKIEAGVRALKLGEVKVVDADGKVVR